MMADAGGSDDRYHLNAGVRVVKTELTIDSSATPTVPNYYGTDSWNGVIANPENITTSRSYTDVLPSFSGVFDVTESDKVRVSAARVMSRQNLFQLGTGSSYNFTRSSTPGPNLNRFLYTNGSGGNPELDPYRASQFDAAYERYFGTQGLLSAACSTRTSTRSSRPTRSRGRWPTARWRARRPASSPSRSTARAARSRALELAAQYAFENGFGFTANYTYSDSKSSNSNDYDDNLPIPGVAKNAFNVQGYYEGHGFEARLSYAWRDKSYQGNFAFGSGADVHNLGIVGAKPMASWTGRSATTSPRSEGDAGGINLTKEDSKPLPAVAPCGPWPFSLSAAVVRRRIGRMVPGRHDTW
jgi:iron complex outermembrane receptor protein